MHWEICMAEQLLSVTLPISVHTFSQSPHVFQNMFSLKCPQLEVMFYSKELLILLHPSLKNMRVVTFSASNSHWDLFAFGTVIPFTRPTVPRSRAFSLWSAADPAPLAPFYDGGCVGAASLLLFRLPSSTLISSTDAWFYLLQWIEDWHLLPWFNLVGYLVNWQQL